MYDNNQENERKIQEVVNLWNETQEHLPQVVMVDNYLKTIILTAYKEVGIDNIKTVFEKVNKTPRLNGTEDSKKVDYHTTIDFVLKVRNCTKILNGDYDKAEPLTKAQREELEGLF